jgi:hypothetical protein
MAKEKNKRTAFAPCHGPFRHLPVVEFVPHPLLVVLLGGMVDASDLCSRFEGRDPPYIPKRILHPSPQRVEVAPGKR